jgi:hypothetical protein
MEVLMSKRSLLSITEVDMLHRRMPPGSGLALALVFFLLTSSSPPVAAQPELEPEVAEWPALDFTRVGIEVGETYAGGGGIASKLTIIRVGDLNNNGYEEVVIGDPGANLDSGRVTVYDVTPQGLRLRWRLDYTANSEEEEWWGQTVACGDFDGDGNIDLVVGAPDAGTEDDFYGSFRVYAGSPGSFFTQTYYADVWGERHENLGAALATGDVNGDGYDDLVVGGARFDNVHDEVQLYLGSESGLITEAPAYKLTDPDATTIYGSALAVGWLGPWEGNLEAGEDPSADSVVVGDRYYGPLKEGRVYVYHWNSEKRALVRKWSQGGNICWRERICGLGAALTIADINSDGFGDIVAGAPGVCSDGGNLRGNGLAVFLGSDEGIMSPLWPGSWAGRLWGLDWGSGWDFFGLGLSVDRAGDVDGDGYQDIIVGAPYARHTGPSEDGAGAAVLLRGSRWGLLPPWDNSPTCFPLTRNPDWWAWGSDVDPRTITYGMTVCGAGDINDDGLDDLIVEGGYEGEDRWAEVLVNTSQSPPRHLRRPTSVVEGSRSAVVSAGDVNGDGFDDVLTTQGSSVYDNRTVYLYLRTASGIEATPAWVARSSQVGSSICADPSRCDNFGRSIAGVDVNGDGYSDVLVGAPGGFDPSNNVKGRVHVFYGGEPSDGNPSGLGPGTLENPALDSDDDETWQLPYDLAYGEVLGSAGDLDGDGRSDWFVCDPLREKTNESGEWERRGLVQIHYSSGGSVGIMGENAGSRFGSAVAFGNVRGDERVEVVVAAPGVDEIHVLTLDEDGTADEVGRERIFVPDLLSSSIVAAADFNSDQYADVICAGDDAVQIFYGREEGLDGLEAPDWIYEEAEDHKLKSLLAGDFVGERQLGDSRRPDGYTDLIVGDMAYPSSGWLKKSDGGFGWEEPPPLEAGRQGGSLAHSGALLVFKGTGSGLPPAPEWIVPAPDEAYRAEPFYDGGATFGSHIACVGGKTMVDGRGDLVIASGNGNTVAYTLAYAYQAGGAQFIRGDPNGDGVNDISDAISILGFLFLGTAPPSCVKSSDVNDDGNIDLSDAVYLLTNLFLGGPVPEPPFPDCGVDETVDDLGCVAHEFCGPEKPDLAVSQEMGVIPAQPVVTDDILVYARIVNRGGQRSAECQGRFRVGPIDVTLDIPPIEPGSSRSLSWRTPLLPGSYTATLTVDIDGDVDELDEENNERSVEFTVR